MKVLVSGAHGLLGTALLTALRLKNHEVDPLPRGVFSGQEDSSILNGADAVVHLAGESIAGRWSESKKQAIRDSRIKGTRRLAELLAQRNPLPKTVICASATGFYGDRGDEVLTEESISGTNFLADVCRGWEAASALLARAGVRVVHLRFGVILSPKGGALAKMLLPFKLGLGGKIGSGHQWMSWIALEDAVGVVQFAMENAALQGAVNTVSPEPITNEVYTKTLGSVLGRPTIFPVPAAAARLVFGEMADELLLASARVQPKKLTENRYSFRYPQLQSALKHLLGR